MAEYLKSNAVEWGASGLNNTWGYGYAQLPSPPDETVDACAAELTGVGEVSGQWAGGCESETQALVSGSGARLARYYSFTLGLQSGVTIDLESSVVTYLYLWGGEARVGALACTRCVNDYHGAAELARNTDSQIQQTLPAGTYTIEATTYAAGATGSCTPTVSGLGGATSGNIVFVEPYRFSV